MRDRQRPDASLLADLERLSRIYRDLEELQNTSHHLDPHVVSKAIDWLTEQSVSARDSSDMFLAPLTDTELIHRGSAMKDIEGSALR